MELFGSFAGIGVLLACVISPIAWINHDDDELIKQATAKGCSVVHKEHDGYQFYCGPGASRKNVAYDYE